MVAVLVRIYAAARKAGAENRKANRIPSTSLHISRTEDWKAAADHPIDRGASIVCPAEKGGPDGGKGAPGDLCRLPVAPFLGRVA